MAKNSLAGEASYPKQVCLGKGLGVFAAGLELPWYDSGHQCAWVPVSPSPCSGQAVGSAPATLTCPKGEGTANPIVAVRGCERTGGPAQRWADGS